MSNSLGQLEVVLEVVKILAIVFGGLGVVLTMLRTAANVIVTVTQAVTKFEFVGNTQAQEIKTLQSAMEKVQELIIKMAVEKTRLDNQGSRLNRLEGLVDDLRRGEGMILPLRPAAEYRGGDK